jgi:hypothetical protein
MGMDLAVASCQVHAVGPYIGVWQRLTPGALELEGGEQGKEYRGVSGDDVYKQGTMIAKRSDLCPLSELPPKCSIWFMRVNQTRNTVLLYMEL